MNPSFQQTNDRSCWLRLKYSRRLSLAFFNKELFYELFPDCNIVSIILVKIVSALGRKLVTGVSICSLRKSRGSEQDFFSLL